MVSTYHDHNKYNIILAIPDAAYTAADHDKMINIRYTAV